MWMQWPPGSHGSTFGGNPVACAAALATIDLLEHGLMDHAAKMGVVVLDALHEAMQVNSAFSGARGIGLMTAVDLPDMATRNKLLQDCFRSGLILLGAGERSIRICPPLVVSEEEIRLAVAIMLNAMSSEGRKPAQAA